MTAKTAISLDDATYQAATGYAQKAGISRSELFSRALREFLSRQQSQAMADALEEVYSADPQDEEVQQAAEAKAIFRRFVAQDER